MTHWLKVEPKQSTLFFKAHISFLIFEEEVEHAIGTLEDEEWQTCEDKSFFKDLFSLEIKSKLLDFKAILFFKVSFSFKAMSSFEDKISFFF